MAESLADELYEDARLVGRTEPRLKFFNDIKFMCAIRNLTNTCLAACHKLTGQPQPKICDLDDTSYDVVLVLAAIDKLVATAKDKLDSYYCRIEAQKNIRYWVR